MLQLAAQLVPLCSKRCSGTWRVTVASAPAPASSPGMKNSPCTGMARRCWRSLAAATVAEMAAAAARSLGVCSGPSCNDQHLYDHSSILPAGSISNILAGSPRPDQCCTRTHQARSQDTDRARNIAKHKMKKHLVVRCRHPVSRRCRAGGRGIDVPRGRCEVGDLAPLPVVQHHLGGGVGVGLAAAQQPPPRPRQLRQEILRVRPALQLVRTPLQGGAQSASDMQLLDTCWAALLLWAL